MVEIKTSRFLLRPVQKGDAPHFAQLCNDLDIARNTARIKHPYTLKDAEDFVAYAIGAAAKGEEHIFAVCDNGKIIACVGVMPKDENAYELGYWVGADYRGVGVATETADAALQFTCTALKPKTLTSGHFVDNPASGYVLMKLGFEKTDEIMTTYSRGRGEEVNTTRMSMNALRFKPLWPVEISL